MRKLFLIQADNEDGENLDFLVIAHGPESATAAWLTCDTVMEAGGKHTDIRAVRPLTSSLACVPLPLSYDGVLPWDLFPDARAA